jgi:hypothetical protein
MLKPHKIRVFYGEPVVFKDAGHGEDKNAHYQNVSAEIMQRIGALM